MFDRKDPLINEQMLPYDYENLQSGKMSRKKKLIIAGISFILVAVLAFELIRLNIYIARNAVHHF